MTIRTNITDDELAAFKAVCPSAARVNFDDHDFYGELGVGVLFSNGAMHGMRATPFFGLALPHDERRRLLLKRTARRMAKWWKENHAAAQTP